MALSGFGVCKGRSCCRQKVGRETSWSLVGYAGERRVWEGSWAKADAVEMKGGWMLDIAEGGASRIPP